MTRRAPFLFLVFLLFAVGFATAAYRHGEYHIPYFRGQLQQVWQVEARLEYNAADGPVQALLTLPPPQDGYRFLSENAASPGYGYDVIERSGQRQARWSRRSASGEQALFFKLDLVQDPNHVEDPEDPPRVFAPTWDEPYRTAAQQVLASALPLSADGLTLAQRLLIALTTDSRSQNAALLLDRYALSDVLADLLAEADVPARRVESLRLEDGRRRQRTVDLVQLWQDGRWHLVVPPSFPEEDLGKLLMWRTSAPSLFELTGGDRSRVSFSMISQARSSVDIANQLPIPESSPLLSLYSLPIDEQSSFKLIMLLPVGALVVVLMRVLVGIKTSGTFMPVLIALAFLETNLLPGIFGFIAVLAVGLSIRSYLSSLNLLLVARIATLIIVVIGITSVFSILGHRLDLIGANTITFFPTIILAWTIERMSIVWEEQGARDAIKQTAGSLAVAVLAFVAMDGAVVRHLAFNFPELHLCVMAIIMLLGRYKGYRLLELTRFATMKG
ncbi:MAG: hypothetical protein ACI8TX_003010 [Hyphomicrobiaceae bacterium]|jgi:hypothetical protein